MNITRQARTRTAGIYVLVLGTSLIVSALALSAVALQRLQNRLQTASSEMRQAQLNAAAAVQLGLLTMEQDEDWRASATDGTWFSDRATGRGTCTLEVTDPDDGLLSDDQDDPVVLVGIGTIGQTEQRLVTTVYPQREPMGCLRYGVAVGDRIEVNSDILRVLGKISAYQAVAGSSAVYGDLEAVGITGGTYYGSTTLVDEEDRPEMPDWLTVFDYYLNNGTQINIADLPTSSPNLALNPSFESGTVYWTGSPPDMGTAEIAQKSDEIHSGSYSIEVKNLSGLNAAGAAQYIDGFVEPGAQYYVEAWIKLEDSVAGLFWLTLHTKGTDSSAQSSTSTSVVVAPNTWTKLSAMLTAPSWSGELEYAFVTVSTPPPLTIGKFHVDDVAIYEGVAGRYIYRKVLSPGLNPFGTGQTNAQGIYWIDCDGNRLIIKRSRIHGTLLVLNAGSGSEIAPGPIHWSPAMPGYPALIVAEDDGSDADFAIRATNRGLSEKENGVNFNPTGSAHDEFGSDSDLVDIYPSEIRGLVAVKGQLVFQNSPLIRGQIIVGDRIDDSSGSLEVEFQPDSVITPPPGFQGFYKYEHRPGASRKEVVP